MLAGNILVLHPFRFARRGLEDLAERPAHGERTARYPGQPFQFRFNNLAHPSDVRPRLFEQGNHNAALAAPVTRLQQGREQVQW